MVKSKQEESDRYKEIKSVVKKLIKIEVFWNGEQTDEQNFALGCA